MVYKNFCSFGILQDLDAVNRWYGIREYSSLFIQNLQRLSHHPNMVGYCFQQVSGFRNWIGKDPVIHQ